MPRNEEIINTDGAISQEQAADILSPIQIIHQGALSLEDIPQQNSSSAPTYIAATEVVAIKKGAKRFHIQQLFFEQDRFSSMVMSKAKISFFLFVVVLCSVFHSNKLMNSKKTFELGYIPEVCFLGF